MGQAHEVLEQFGQQDHRQPSTSANGDKTSIVCFCSLLQKGLDRARNAKTYCSLTGEDVRRTPPSQTAFGARSLSRSPALPRAVPGKVLLVPRLREHSCN